MEALVIDDSRAVRMMIGAVLREQGYTVFEAGDGQEGLAQLAANPDIRLALVDWNMPVMDGLTFIQEVRSSTVWKDLQLVMVTTESESGQIQKAVQAGANEYVMKPFTADVLIAKLSLLGAFEE